MASPREGFAKIRREHVEQACVELQREGGRVRGGSYFVKFAGAEFPAKRVLRTAYRLAHGSDISVGAFSGGVFTARILEALGFEVVVRQARVQ